MNVITKDGWMTDKVKQVIWVYDMEKQVKKRINLQTLLKRINLALITKNKYFALKGDRDQFAKDFRSRSGPRWNLIFASYLKKFLGFTEGVPDLAPLC